MNASVSAVLTWSIVAVGFLATIMYLRDYRGFEEWFLSANRAEQQPALG